MIVRKGLNLDGGKSLKDRRRDRKKWGKRKAEAPVGSHRKPSKSRKKQKSAGEKNVVTTENVHACSATSMALTVNRE